MPTPVIWLAKEGVCSHCRMDEWFIEDLLQGAQKRPFNLPTYEYVSDVEDPRITRPVVIVPAGSHDAPGDVEWLNARLARFERVVLILTSDEMALFPVERLSHPALHLWVQTPRPERRYPLGTTFFGIGSGRAWGDVEVVDKDVPLFFAGQKTHVRRDRAVANAHRVAGSKVIATESFMAGLPRPEYFEWMQRAMVVPCPSGPDTQDSFRAYEAMEMGALPLLDALRPDGAGLGYWDMVAPGWPFGLIADWDVLAGLEDPLAWYPRPQITAHAWWHWRRRELAQALAWQGLWLNGEWVGGHPMTVVIPTSPIPSHPSTDIIEEVIDSVRARTEAEILIMVDRPRPELMHRDADYLEYVRRLLLLCEHHWWNVTPIVYQEHLHQAEMLRRTLDHVDSEFILFVEHDTPLVNDIDFDAIIATMVTHELRLMRLHYDGSVHPEHEWLMVDDVQPGGWRPTMQWSQRPHLAQTRWYKANVLGMNFDRSARVMIEDVMFGVCEHAWRVHGKAGWARWRLAIWHPEGTIQRSFHLDGRGADSKFHEQFRYRYPGGVTPPGAPNPIIGIP